MNTCADKTDALMSILGSYCYSLSGTMLAVPLKSSTIMDFVPPFTAYIRREYGQVCVGHVQENHAARSTCTRASPVEGAVEKGDLSLHRLFSLFTA
jgi:hypothetical protein